MKVISFLNIKGGVAKTTSAINITAELGKLGYKTLLVDLDPQANASYCMPHKKGITSFEVLGNFNLVNEIASTTYKNVYIITAGIDLVKYESKLDKENKTTEYQLDLYLESIKDNFDFVLIDCPPSLGMLSTNALVASDYVLVPIKIDNFALLGLDYLISCIEQVKQDFNPKLKLLGIFITLDERSNINKQIKRDIEQAFGDKFFKQTIRKNVDVVKSTFENIPVSYYNKKANAAKDYKELTREVLACLI